MGLTVLWECDVKSLCSFFLTVAARSGSVCGDRSDTILTGSVLDLLPISFSSYVNQLLFNAFH